MRLHRSVVVAVAALACAAPAAAGKTAVGSPAQFHAAVASMRATGGVVVLEPGRYPHLTVGRRPAGARPLIVRGRPGASVRLVTLRRTHDVQLIGVTVEPRVKRDARVDVFRSRGIVVRNVTFAGTDGRFARVRLRGARQVTIAASDFTACGVGLACVALTGGNRNVRVLGSRFHDCVGCDFIRGRFAAWMTLRGNIFTGALSGGCVTLVGCNHQDLVQLDGGRGLHVEGNTFGVYEFGAAQLFVRSGVGVTIRGNVFEPADPGPLGLMNLNAIVLGTHLGWAPRRVVIEGNDILAGGPRPGFYTPAGVATSVLLWPAFDALPVEDRPAVRGNTIGVSAAPEWFCARLRESEGNHILRGVACSDTDTTDGG